MKTQKKHVVLTLLALIIAIIPTFGISNVALVRSNSFCSQESNFISNK